MELETDKAVDRGSFVRQRHGPRDQGQGGREGQSRPGDLYACEGGCSRSRRNPPRTARAGGTYLRTAGGAAGVPDWPCAPRARRKNRRCRRISRKPRAGVHHARAIGQGCGHGTPRSGAAAPHVRRLAREIGVDVHNVRGSGPGGRISEDDVKLYAKNALISGAAAAAQAPRASFRPSPSCRTSPSGARSNASPCAACAAKPPSTLAEAWNTIPHVTQHDRADITELEQLRARFAPRPRKPAAR